VVLNYMTVGCFKYKLVLHCPTRYTSHTPSGRDVFWSHRSRQTFVRILHTEYKWLWACMWSGSILHCFNITTM